MDKAKGILYTTAAVVLFALNRHPTPFFVLVHALLFALGISYIVRAARED
jgi:hypothetical protein